MNNEIIKVEDNNIVATQEGIKLIKKIQKATVELNMMNEKLKQAFLEKMEDNNIKNYTSPDGTFKVTYYAATTQSRIDSKKLKEEEPTIYEKYTTVSPKKAYVKFN